MKFSDTLKERLRRSIETKQEFLKNDWQLAAFQQMVDVVVSAYQSGGRLYIAGNGGSAADAQHLAAEFVSKLAKPRDPLPAEALTVDTSILTAIGNDYGYDEVFSRQIAGKMKKGDVFLAITTSGHSPNILRALEKCREMGITTLLLTGRDGGKARALADHVVIVPAEDTSLIQEVHMVLYHTLCGCVEEMMFPTSIKEKEKERWVTES